MTWKYKHDFDYIYVYDEHTYTISGKKYSIYSSGTVKNLANATPKTIRTLKKDEIEIQYLFAIKHDTESTKLFAFRFSFCI